MLLRQLLFAATTAAFLVVPDASAFSDEDVVNALPIDQSADAFILPLSTVSQSVDLPCKGCRGRDTHLRMDFAIEDGSRLTLNGFELYPNADPWHGDLSALVVKGNGKERKQRLGYSLAVKPQGVDERQEMEVIGVEVKIIEVGNRFVEGIPSVNVKLVKVPTQEILMGSLEINEPSATKCHSMWCRVQNSFTKGFRGCRKFRQGQVEQGESDRQHHRHHGHSHHHDDGHQWRELIKGMASHIFLPVLMGVTAGFGVALFVMILCRIAFRLTRLVRGDEQPAFMRCPRRKSMRAIQTFQDEEKAALMQDQEESHVDDANLKN